MTGMVTSETSGDSTAHRFTVDSGIAVTTRTGTTPGTMTTFPVVLSDISITGIPFPAAITGTIPAIPTFIAGIATTGKRQRI